MQQRSGGAAAAAPLSALWGQISRVSLSPAAPRAFSRSPSIFHNLKVKAVIRDRRDALSDAPRQGGIFGSLTVNPSVPLTVLIVNGGGFLSPARLINCRILP